MSTEETPKRRGRPPGTKNPPGAARPGERRLAPRRTTTNRGGSKPRIEREPVSAEERKAYLSAKGKISRARGAEWERYYARYLTKTLGLEFRRNLTQYQQKGCGDLLTKLDSLYRSVFIEVKYRSVETHSTFFRETVVKYGNAALEAEAPFLLVIYKLQGKAERCWFGLAKDAASKTADFTPYTLDDALHVMKATVYGGE